jgi:Anti-sigma-K factor rskA.
MAELAALADGSLAPERRARSRRESRRLRSWPTGLSSNSGRSRSRERCERGRGTGGATGAHRRASTCAPRAGASSSRSDRRPCDRCAGVAIGVVVIGSGASSERFHAALAATEQVPGARGEATLTKTASGWRIELDATGLPRLAGGRFYEAWLRNPAGVLVPIGTFNESRNVTLWAGVSPKLFSTLTVTREQADGDQTSSGEKVLVGRVNTGG